MSLASIHAKANDSGFRSRLAVALTDQCRWMIQIDQPSSGMSADRYAHMQTFARSLRMRVTSAEWLTRYALWVLLPDGSFDADDDEQLKTKVAAIFVELADEAPPA